MGQEQDKHGINFIPVSLRANLSAEGLNAARLADGPESQREQLSLEKGLEGSSKGIRVSYLTSNEVTKVR